MNYYYNSQDNSDNLYDISPIQNSSGNIEDNQNENNIYENPYQKYLMQNNPKMTKAFDLNSSQEEINSKEEIIETKNDEEILNSGSGKFRFVNTKAGKEDKIDKINFSSPNNNNKNNDKSNKITNNICIIINKPEVKDIENNKNGNDELLYTKNKNIRIKNNQNINKNKNNNNNIKSSQHKKNNSYILNNKNKKKANLEPPEEFENYNYSYIETEPNENGRKITMHKKLRQKEKKLKDLEKNIQNKKISLKDKKNLAEKKEKKHARSTTFDKVDKKYRKKNDLKEENISYESSKNEYNKRKNNSKNKNLENKSINSEDRIFNDIPMIKIEKNKCFDEEENIYKTMSPDISNDKYNISFNKSIEQKRRLLGIPLYKNEFPNYNKNGKDLSKEEKKNRSKLEVYKKRQDEILKNYEKKNLINQKSRDMIKNNKRKNKTPIRITYNDNYNKAFNSNSNYFDKNNNNVNDNKKGDTDEKQKNNYNKKTYIKNQNKRNNSQSEIDKYTKKNKTQTQNYANNKDQTKYLQKKIKVYKQKEKSKEKKENKNKPIKDNKREGKELIEFKILPSKNEVPKEKKVYENNTYYSKLISKLFNYKDIDSNKASKNNSDNKNVSNNSNSNNNYYNSKKKNNKKINNYKDVSPFRSKELFSSPKHNEIMTIQDNENGKTLRIVKKRHKSPKKVPDSIQNAQQYQNQNNYSQIKRPEKEIDKNEKEKKEYTNKISNPGRGISALRRINQKIENYKKRIPSRKRRRVKNKSKNPQYKSFTQLKKIGKHPFTKGVKQSKSIKTLPDVNKEVYQNFDFIDDI